MMTLNQYMIFNVYNKPEIQNVSIRQLVKIVALMSNGVDGGGK
jgi:hypothetical protein